MEVVSHVEQQIRLLGTSVIPFLEEEWESVFNPTLQRRIEDLVHQLQFELLKERLLDWKENDQDNLLKGLWLIATYQYPDLEYEELSMQIDQMYFDVWTSFRDDLAPFDQVRTINRVVFDKLKFRANTRNFHSPANSMINAVLDSHKGNPISLSSIYLLIAQRLKLPIYGVSLPNLFILVYKTDAVRFYINVFNKGLIFTKEDIDNYIDHLQLSRHEIFYEPCSHLEIVNRFLRNLIVSFEKVGEYEKGDELKMILKFMDPASGTY
ncbi:MAG: transglutaminase-like domain-containing protein [Cyclobacteriaceae bacterium]|nr:transglutaminase-like domain-containing protein [Cyclobacteriaceae bacterium]